MQMELSWTNKKGEFEGCEIYLKIIVIYPRNPTRTAVSLL